MAKHFVHILVLAAAGWLTGPPAAGQQPASTVVIHAGRLIDGVSAGPRERVSILVSGDRITAVQDGFAPPPPSYWFVMGQRRGVAPSRLRARLNGRPSSVRLA